MEYFLLYSMGGSLLLSLIAGAISIFWLSPVWKWCRLRKNGLSGPSPHFPLGNLMEMSKKGEASAAPVTHDIHSSVFPYFSRWRNAYGKTFVYWLGTEPFLYVADPEFLKRVTSGAMGKKWGKPNVFKHDRRPMFGTGLVMADGDDWTRHRHIISPAFSMTNLNAMISVMQETTNKMLKEWGEQLALGQHEIDVEIGVTKNAAEIIAKTSFGISEEKGKKVFEKLQLMQKMLFKTNRLVGVPLGKMLSAKKSYQAWKLGKEIDQLLFAIISSRKQEYDSNDGGSTTHRDLLGLLLAGNQDNAQLERKLTTRELVDECKTFFFGGHETTALALSWTLLLLALHPEWQTALRDELMQVSGGRSLDSTMLSRLTKMGWVWNEVLRLYPPAPNVQRQAREDVETGDGVVIPRGTNMWVDAVGMHHDPALWGDDANEFRPERFKEEIHGGCKHRMGFVPFGFGGRICIGRNLTLMEFKIVLSLILREFSLTLSPSYSHSPRIMLSLRPSQGVQLILNKI
ncbi:cytokinin hydroxylase-like [Canna indica]|uniref:Cytokinin hydroxylase-like n=1 Tax=Canna indica TaxID=4628 RepID=A0AAQ3JP93_9LILI|nr:cytokinin hydroxylase-like [Canna indica]